MKELEVWGLDAKKKSSVMDVAEYVYLTIYLYKRKYKRDFLKRNPHTLLILTQSNSTQFYLLEPQVSFFLFFYTRHWVCNINSAVVFKIHTIYSNQKFYFNDAYDELSLECHPPRTLLDTKVINISEIHMQDEIFPFLVGESQ